MLRLRHDVLRKPLGLNLYQQDLSQEANYWHFGLFDDNAGKGQQLLACLIIVPLDKHHGLLKQMAVDPQNQGQRLGKQLIAEAEQYLTTQGMKQLELSARQQAIGFYQKLGYQPIGEPYIEVTISHQLMRKDLTL